MHIFCPFVCRDLAETRARPNIALMVKTVLSIRHARPGDAEAITRCTMFPGATLTAAHSGGRTGAHDRAPRPAVVALGDPSWDGSSSRLDFDHQIVGYATYGRNRVPSMPYSGEIFEIYLMPEYQGLGFGRRLFNAARRELAEHGYLSTIVWALADNDKAPGFYQRLGGLTDSARRRAIWRRYVDLRVAFGFVSRA